MALRLREIGSATAYATVGVGDVVPEMKTARKAAENSTLLPPEIVFLLGQADIATIYETSNFKQIFELRYPRAKSHASVVNWVFSVPFTVGRETAPTIEEAPFRFMIHLRLRRAVYAYRGIEEKIVDKLSSLLRGHRDSARIHVGLGWSDLIVEGFFTNDSFEDLVRFIIDVHGLRIALGADREPTIPVLQRILTVFGYRGEDPPEFTSNRHVTFLRCKPGGFDDVVDLFTADDRVVILDGKADFMIASDVDAPKWLVRQRQLGDGRYKRFLRKVETHLMFFEAEPFARRAAAVDLLIDAGDEALHQENCGCDTSSKELLDEIDHTIDFLKQNRLLPTEQRYAIDNTLFLLGAALRDSSTCCDMRDAVTASFGGLLKTLQRIRSNGPEATPEQYKQMWEKLDEWHRLSELLLRQRIVGSYEEILGTSDRSIVYSGGVQKFLYLADQVMMDFAGAMQPINPPKFATIYDSVKTIYSYFASGPLVRIPTSQIFSFPLIVPDLWHEVAGALFFLRYQDEFAKLAPEENYNEFLANIADHYADLMVYLFGFRGDFTRFAVSLFHGWRLVYREAPPAVTDGSRAHLLLRLYLVFEFDQFRAIHRERNAAKVLALADDTFDVLIRDLEARVETLCTELNRIPAFKPGDWDQLRQNVADSETFHEMQRQFYRPFIETEVAAGNVDLTRFEAGEIVPLSDEDDLNALFGELAYKLARMWPETDFRTTAALGESIAIEYHRRQMRKREGDGA